MCVASITIVGANAVNEVLNDNGLSNTTAILVSPANVNDKVEGSWLIAGTGAIPVNEVLNDKGLSNTIALLVSPDNDNVCADGSTVMFGSVKG